MCLECRDKSLVSIGNTHDNAKEKEKFQVFTYYSLYISTLIPHAWNDNICDSLQSPLGVKTISIPIQGPKLCGVEVSTTGPHMIDGLYLVTFCCLLPYYLDSRGWKLCAFTYELEEARMNPIKLWSKSWIVIIYQKPPIVKHKKAT